MRSFVHLIFDLILWPKTQMRFWLIVSQVLHWMPWHLSTVLQAVLDRRLFVWFQLIAERSNPAMLQIMAQNLG